MYNIDIENIAYIYLGVVIILQAWFFFKKRRHPGGLMPCSMISKYFLVAVFIIVLTMPVNGAAKSIYQSGHESTVNIKLGLPGQVPQHFLKVLIATGYQARLSKANEYTHTHALILFIEQQGNHDEDGLSIFMRCLFLLILGVGSGYLVRDWISRRRTKRAKAQRATEHLSTWPPKLLRDFPITPPAIQKTTGQQATTTPVKENTRQTATPVKENIPETKSPVIVEWEGFEMKPNTKTSDILYFPNPNSEGNFRKADGRGTFIEGASIYKFTLSSANEAKFEFCHEQSSVSIALSNRGQFILSVADEVNEYNLNAHKILAFKYGVASLDGSIWKIITKAKIRYV